MLRKKSSPYPWRRRRPAWTSRAHWLTTYLHPGKDSMLLWLRNVPCRLMYLSTWSLIGGLIWEGYETFKRLRKYVMAGRALRVYSLTLPTSCSPSTSCVWLKMCAAGSCSASMHPLPAVMPFLRSWALPLQPQAKRKPFLLKSLLVMAFYHSNKQ